MPQFDVLANPIPRARHALPFVMILQSDLAETGRERVVAPLAPHAAMPPFAGRLVPVLEVAGVDHVLLVPSLTSMPAADLCHAVVNLADERDRIMAALDYLFIGF